MELSSNLLKGVFLIVLTIIGTTVENTFSCQTLKVLHTNMFAKQIIIFCLIYFTIDFTDDKQSHPIDTFKTTINIWLLYIIISKQNLYFTMINFSLLVVLYVLYNYDDYLNKVLNESSGERNTILKKIKYVKQIKTYGKHLFIVCAIVGFIFYFVKEKREHTKNFTYTKFLFGTNKCDNFN